MPSDSALNKRKQHRREKRLESAKQFISGSIFEVGAGLCAPTSMQQIVLPVLNHA